jgi:type I restriction enzyme, S subunit
MEVSVKCSDNQLMHLTPAGPLPTDWTATTVGHEFHVDLGKMLDAEKNTGTSKPFIGNKAVQWGRVDVSEVREIRLTNADIQRYSLRAGDLLVCEGGEVGRAAIWHGELPECYYQKALHRLRATRGYSHALMASVLQRFALTGRLQDFVTQTSIAHLPKEKFLALPIPLPASMAEQNLIAAALTDADSLITALEQLLTKKRQIKQGAMQELLTGKRRLPGFGGEWNNRRLPELADIRSGGTPSTRQLDFWEGVVPWCTPTDITALAGHKHIAHTERTISEKGLKASSAELLPAGTVVMTSRATIGECAIASMPLSTNQGFKNFVPREGTSGEFLYYLLCTQQQEFLALCSGSTFLEIGKRQLVEFTVRCPDDHAEQTAIAQILSDLDTAITALEARLTKARAMKQGMAQALLTGRIRLVGAAGV